MAGFETRLPNGKLQMQAVKPQLVLAASGSVSTIANTGTNQRYESGNSWANIDYSGGYEPLLVIRPASSVAYMGTVFAPTEAGSSNFSWRVAGAAAAGTSIQYWIFDIPTSFPNTSGLEIYGLNNEPIWHSSQKPFKPVAKLTVNQFNGPAGGAGAYGGIAGKIYGAAFSSYIGGWNWIAGARNPDTGINSPEYYRYAGAGIAVVGVQDGLSFPRYTHSPSTGGNGTHVDDIGPNVFYPGQILVADVTHF